MLYRDYCVRLKVGDWQRVGNPVQVKPSLSLKLISSRMFVKTGEEAAAAEVKLPRVMLQLTSHSLRPTVLPGGLRFSESKLESDNGTAIRRQATAKKGRELGWLGR